MKINLKNICFDGDIAELSKTQNLQPAIVTISYGIYKLLEKENIIPSAAAGFSLGEMSAFASLGVLSFTDALNLVKIRGEVMEKACGHTSGAMYSIIGLDDTAVENICAEIGANSGKCIIPANYNCPGQIVISGETEAVEIAAKIFAEKGARTVRLNVSGAFHSELMTRHGSFGSLADFLNTLDFNNTPTDFYSNISGKKINFSEDKITKQDLKAFMIDYIPKQMSSPVRFRAELENMELDGIDNFAEIGVGKVLSGFIRRTCKNANFANIEDYQTFAKYIAECQLNL
jgi:[acyl-carrier-protein] S-malonyltransferase